MRIKIEEGREGMDNETKPNRRKNNTTMKAEIINEIKWKNSSTTTAQIQLNLSTTL